MLIILLNALLSYCISLAANERTGAIAESRKKKLDEALANEDALRQALQTCSSIREDITAACTQNMTQFSMTENQTPLWQLLSNEQFQDHFYTWLASGHPVLEYEAKESILSEITRVLSDQGIDDKHSQYLKESYFENLDKLILTTPLLSNLRQQAKLQFIATRITAIDIAVADSQSLHLTPWAAMGPQQQATDDVQLLQPYHRALKMVGRDEDWRKLQHWLDSDKPISVRTVTGPGGTGKTRMALELLRDLPTKKTWVGGFLDRQELARFLGTTAFANWKLKADTLIVIDYAATSDALVRDFLTGLCACRSTVGHRLRILLLEREASTTSGWLQFVRTSGHSTPVEELFDPIEPQRLQPISSIEHRRQILQHMFDRLKSLADSQGRTVRVPQLPVDDPVINDLLEDRHNKEDRWKDPLYLMMAALLAMDGDIVRVLKLSRRAIAQQTVDHELSRLRKFAANNPNLEWIITHLAAVATLRGGLRSDEIIPTITAECEALGQSDIQGPRALAKILKKALPLDSKEKNIDFISPILPDLLGEAVILQQFCSLSNDDQESVIRRAVLNDPVITAVTILRTCHDYAEDEQSPAIRWLDTLMHYAQQHKPELFMVLWRQLPMATTVLRSRALKVVQQCLKLDQAKEEQFQAQLLNALAIRLSELGRRQEALENAQQAVEIRRKLEKANPDAFLPDLAMSLNTLANRLSELGRRQEALENAQQAVETYRKLAEANPDAFLPNFAASLNNLATFNSELGRRQEALENAQQAVEIRRKLAEANPDAFLPGLATSLNNLATFNSELGRRQEALENAQQAVEIRRKLADANPDAFLPDLAMSLNNLAIQLSELGRRQEALENVQKAVEIRRKLAEANPDAFLPNLAMSYGTLGSVFTASDEHDKAAQAYAQGIEAITPCLQAIPRAFAGLATKLVSDYLEAKQKLDEEPDKTLLMPVEQVLQTLQNAANDQALSPEQNDGSDG